MRVVPTQEHKDALKYVRRLLAVDQDSFADVSHQLLDHKLLSFKIVEICDDDNRMQ